MWDMVVRWEYPPMGKAMLLVWLKEVEKYILCCQNTVEQYIVTCPILELCLTAERWLVSQVS